MNLPEKIDVTCPACRQVTEHSVLTGRINEGAGITLEAKVKCDECGRIHRVTIKTGKLREIPLIISEMDQSSKTVLDIYSDEWFRVDEEIELDGKRLLITAIEIDNESRVKRAKGSEIKTVWAKVFDQIRIGISVNRGERTSSYEQWVDPDAEYSVGETIDVNGLNLKIKSIKTKHSKLRRGGAAARDVIRLYATDEATRPRLKTMFWRRTEK
ncbi:MAG: hypothetical protein CVT48_03615 [Thermoplasmata archaeon HGW-Thermoplasmata-1]|nr:MAG: hypothetical protein CVT48_03615 [Thermoplasmata archaeon HGW-Thermoplasmata-1]